DSDNKRQLFVNSVTFWSWYTGSWSNIKFNNTIKTLQTISQADFDKIDNGTNMTARPGVRIIKFPNSPKIYSVISNGKLAVINDQTIAASIFGSDWATKVITIQNGFEGDYTKDGKLNVDDHDLWSIISQLAEALKNHDLSLYNYVADDQFLSEDFNQFIEYANWFYSEVIKLKESDFSIHLQDWKKQAVYATDWVRTETADNNGYERKLVVFIKDNGLWKISSITVMQSVGVLKSSGASGESELQSMIIDSDKDGVTDWEETCSGANAYNPKCVKTDPNKLDTDGDGWWDGVK
ncbi:MAG: hypothetical protein Q7K65_01605, partial [Candidatus Buchananbacteria bacterium]|nr:hypothetical protein [Candidatus Buchananbacteria bacterium]